MPQVDSLGVDVEWGLRDWPGYERHEQHATAASTKRGAEIRPEDPVKPRQRSTSCGEACLEGLAIRGCASAGEIAATLSA
jgi:hypothetical protein